MPLLVRDYAEFTAETKRLTALLASTSQLDPKHRKYIAEIALVRLAILIENSMKSVFCKLSCGATYIDGSAPTLLAQQRNAPAAISAMQNHGRAKFRYRLPWNDGAEIRENIKFLIDPSDRCNADLVTHASFLTDIRSIRNHIAHRNDNSRTNFVKLIRRYYGAKVPGVTCGNLLVSPRVSPNRPLLETYIISANVMIKEIVRG
jgi:hypothetical protein